MDIRHGFDSKTRMPQALDIRIVELLEAYWERDREQIEQLEQDINKQYNDWKDQRNETVDIPTVGPPWVNTERAVVQVRPAQTAN